MLPTIRTFENKGVQYQIPETLQQGRYRVTGVLARGGMGIIYKALDTRLHNKMVLIKSLIYKPSIFQYKSDKARDEEILARREQMRSEKVVLQYLWERGIGGVPIVLDAFEDFNPMLHGPHRDESTGDLYTCSEFSTSDPYLVLNYFDGVPVGDWVLADPTQRQNFAKRILVSITKILEVLHQPYRMTLTDGREIVLQCIYGDMKPGNIIHTTDKSIVLIDLGSVVKKINGNIEGIITTTPGYCAPEVNEQLQNSILAADVTPAVDVYSLAATLYEILARQPPAVSMGHNQFDFSLIRRDFPAWEKFLLTALDELPQNRFQNMAQMRAAYYAMVEGKTQASPPVDRGEISRRLMPPQRRVFFAFPGWETRHEHWEQRIFLMATLQKLAGNFYLNAQGLYVDASRLTPLIPLTSVERTMYFPSLKLQLQQVSKILCKNKVYLPELLEEYFSDEYFYIIYKSKQGNSINKDNPDKNYIYKRISRIINTFIDMHASGILLPEISWDEIRFDITDAPLFTHVSRLTHLEHPQQAFPQFLLRMLQPRHSAPEIVQLNEFNEKTYSYLVGRLLLEFLADARRISLDDIYRGQDFLEKDALESWAGHLTNDPVLQKFLLHSLAIPLNFRASLWDLRSLLADGDINTHQRAGHAAAVQGNLITILSNFHLDYQRIYARALEVFGKRILYQSFAVRRNGGTTKLPSFVQVVVHAQPEVALQQILQQHAQPYLILCINSHHDACFQVIDRHARNFKGIFILTDNFNYSFRHANVHVQTLLEFQKRGT